MHGVGTPQSTSQELSVLAYVRKKALKPGRKIECTRARMMGKSPDVQFGIQFNVKETTFYDESSFFLDNWRRVSNRVRLFIIKPFHILIIQI